MMRNDRAGSVSTRAVLCALVGALAVVMPSATARAEYYGASAWPTDAQCLDPTDSRAYYPTVVRDSSGFTMWYDGNYDAGTRRATSSDGVNWTDYGALATVPSNVRHTAVVNTGNGYGMWYWDTSELYGIEAIGHATSSDGITWSGFAPITQDANRQLVDGSGWNRGSYGPGAVIYNPDGSGARNDNDLWDNRYVMYYDGTTGGDEAVGLAYSADGVDWARWGPDQPVLEGSYVSGDWDYHYATHCSVIVGDDGVYHMWYSGCAEGTYGGNHGIGYATSADGVTWVRDTSANPIYHFSDGVDYRSVRTYAPSVVALPNGDLQMWFGARDANGNYSIGTASTPEPVTMALVPCMLTLVGWWRRRRIRGDDQTGA